MRVCCRNCNLFLGHRTGRNDTIECQKRLDLGLPWGSVAIHSADDYSCKYYEQFKEIENGNQEEKSNQD